MNINLAFLLKQLIKYNSKNVAKTVPKCLIITPPKVAFKQDLQILAKNLLPMFVKSLDCILQKIKNDL